MLGVAIQRRGGDLCADPAGGTPGSASFDSSLSDAVRSPRPDCQAGPTGPAGAAGPVGLVHVVIAQGDSTPCAGTADCSIGSAAATCPAGTKPFGGGGLTDALNGTFMGSINTANGYTVGADNYGSSLSASLTAFAYCSADVASIQFPSGGTTRARRVDLVAQRLAARRG